MLQAAVHCSALLRQAGMSDLILSAKTCLAHVLLDNSLVGHRLSAGGQCLPAVEVISQTGKWGLYIHNYGLIVLHTPARASLDGCQLADSLPQLSAHIQLPVNFFFHCA